MIMIAAISDEALISINSVEIVAIIYLAIAISRLRSDLSKLQGQYEQYTSNHKEAGS